MKLPYIVLFYLLGLYPFYAPAQIGPSTSPGSVTAGATPNSTQANQNQGTSAPNQGGQSSTELNQVIVVGQLNEARDQIVPYLGATKYTIGQQ